MNVVLIHGLFMNEWVMYALGRHLAQHGFVAHYFDYASRTLTARQHAQQLRDFVQSQSLLPCHFVGHSLGGLILRHLADIAPEMIQGRVVTLGTPHQGSVAAKQIHQKLPSLLGYAWQNGLDGKLPEWRLTQVDLGCIIGVNGNGLGKYVLQLPEPNDGTVCVNETGVSGSQVLMMDCGHTGLLFDGKTAQAVVDFLQNGCFRLPETEK